MRGISISRLAIFLVALSGLNPSNSFSDTTASPNQLGTKQGSKGEYLVDSKGMTLYIFDTDSAGTGKSNCYGQCAKDWPPLLVPSANAMSTTGDAKSSMMGTLKRTDGSTQVTYNGWPLYYYVQDKNPGDTKGEGVIGDGGGWWLMKPDGSRQ